MKYMDKYMKAWHEVLPEFYLKFTLVSCWYNIKYALLKCNVFLIQNGG